MDIEEFDPTDEQIHARTQFLSGGNLKINAYAGAGKTRTLTLLAGAAEKPSLYLAFNRDIVDAAEGEFPKWVTSATTHSVARAFVTARWAYTDDQLKGIATDREISNLLRITNFTDFSLPFGRPYSPPHLGGLIKRTVRNFTNSSALIPGESHVPGIPGLELLGESERVTKETEIASVVLPYARRLWDSMLDIKSPVPLGHDGYFKLWTLEEKQLNYDCVYLDEAQDSNAPLLDLLQRQRCQIVYVGDPYQSIYTFRGAINAMTEVQIPHEAALTTCFRFGQAIADAAFKVIRTIGADKPLQGHPPKKLSACSGS